MNSSSVIDIAAEPESDSPLLSEVVVVESVEVLIEGG